MTDEKKSVADEATEQKDTAGAESTQDNADSLDSLLAQYDEESAKSDPVKPDTSKSDETEATQALAEIRQWKQEQSEERMRSDLVAAAKAIRGDVIPDSVSDNKLIALMNEEAEFGENKNRIRGAFQDRKKNPKAWDAVVHKILAPELQKMFSATFDKKMTGDREAVSAAVRGASTRASDTDAPSVGEIASWPQDKQDRYAREVSKQYGKG